MPCNYCTSPITQDAKTLTARVRDGLDKLKKPPSPEHAQTKAPYAYKASQLRRCLDDLAPDYLDALDELLHHIAMVELRANQADQYRHDLNHYRRRADELGQILTDLTGIDTAYGHTAEVREA